MSELPPGVAPAEPPQPRDSAAAVVIARDGSGWRVLLGLRGRATRFMPGHLAFPGGAVDRADRPGEPGAFARCASRELLEETGLAIAPGDSLEAGERITPPMFPVRFRTRFFVAAIEAPAGALVPSNTENERLELANPEHACRDWEQGRTKVPPPVLPILRAFAGAPLDAPQALAARIAATNALEQHAPRIEFHPGVWVLPVRTATLPPATHTNVWMPGAGRFVIIDPGSGERAELERLLAVVERRRATGAVPHAVLLTHEHRDHTGGALDVARVLGVPLAAHPHALDRLQGGAAERRALDDGERLDLDGASLRVVATPGHAPGHLAFLVEPSRLLIAGDLASGLSTVLIDPAHGDMGAYLASLARARDLGCAAVLPGHGAPLPAAELDRLIEHRRERERRIVDWLDRHRERQSLAAIAEAAYTGQPGLPQALIERQTLAHLVQLEREARARRDDAPGRSWSAASGAGS